MWAERGTLHSGHVSDHLRWLRAMVPDLRVFAPRVALLVDSLDGGSVLADRHGRLPWADVELETSLGATARGLLRGLGWSVDGVTFEPVAALSGRAWWEDHPEVGRLQPVWVVVRVRAPGGALVRQHRLEASWAPVERVPLAVAATAREHEPPPVDGPPDAGVGGDYIARVRPRIGTARIFYPWAGMALRDPAGRLLLVRLADQAQWHCPGGGMEIGETPEATAVRELREETGLEAQPRRLLGCFSRHVRSFANGDRIQGVALFMDGVVTAGELRADQTGEIDAMGWFDSADLPPLHAPWDARVRLATDGSGTRFG